MERAECIIVANAPELDAKAYIEHIQAAGRVIAADGGASALLRAGIIPDLVIGDLDSLNSAEQEALEAAGAELRRFPRAKDETDLELALLEAAAQGFRSIDILGALGGRWDHTLANVALLAMEPLRGRRVCLLDQRQMLYLVRDQAIIRGQRGDTISLIPLTAAVQGITTHGLQYALDNATLSFEHARGISNVLLEPPAHVSIGAGLLLIVQHDDGGALQWRGGV